MRPLAGFALGLAPLAVPCAAQDSAGVVVTHGIDGDLARGLFAQMGAARRTRDNCWQLGCLLILNESTSYEVTGFYVDTAKPGEPARWSSNQFGSPLQPMRVTLRFKSGGAAMCDAPIRLVLRRRGSQDTMEVLGTTGLCSTPHQDSLLRVKVSEPSVTVEDPAAAAAGSGSAAVPIR